MVEAFVLPSVFFFFLVKNSLSFINKLPYFFTKITVYIPTLPLPLEKMFLLALLSVHIVVINVRVQSDYNKIEYRFHVSYLLHV